jgi:ABC-2 type transport system ATP-binding protein
MTVPMAAPRPAPGGDSQDVIVVRNLSKTFRPPGSVRDLLRGRLHGRPLQALTDISFSVRDGEIVCIMGENGAGKSTLLRVLAGLLTPTTGSASVDGHSVADSPAQLRRHAAFVVGDERSFQWAISGRENLYYFAALHGLSATQARTRAHELLHRVGLGAAADRRFREYSRGMRQRLAIARGLLGAPRVLLLDEPTLGLDPRGARDLRIFLRDETIRGAGRTAVLCSNDPGEVRALADRVLFLEGGRLKGEGTPDRIESELGL